MATKAKQPSVKGTLDKKPSKKKDLKASNSSDIQTEKLLQGLVLADSFDVKFTPITLEAPRALFPIANIPLLDYTLEFLAAGGVQEIFVLCCAHSEKIEEYIKKSQWNNMHGLSVKIITVLDATSTGDALRAVHSRGVLTSDFVLVSGDVVSNMKLSTVLKAHNERKKADKSCIMTMVLKKAQPSHRTRSLHGDIVVGIDKNNSKLVYFDSSNDPTSKSIEIEVGVFEKHSAIQMRYDLLDCRIDICSPEVLGIFFDNFDYMDLRTDFIKGITSGELDLSNIYTHVISGEYAARAKCLRTYDSVNKDIMHRWTYPLVPDNNFMNNTTFKLARGMVYIEQNVTLNRTAKVRHECIIGEGTTVGKDSVIVNSVIGRNCKIGNNVTLHGSYLWGDVTIEDNVTIHQSIICNGAIIYKDSTIEKGCLISYNVKVGPSAKVPELSKLTTAELPDDDPEDAKPQLKDINLGSSGSGKLLVRRVLSDKYNSLIGYNMAIHEDEQELFQEGSDMSDSDEEDKKAVTDEIKFNNEGREILKGSFAANHSIENVTLELNSLKFAYNTTFADSAIVILQTMLDRAIFLATDKKESSVANHFGNVLQQWSALLKKFVTSENDQIDIILTAQDYADENPVIKNIFEKVIHKLYECDILEEGAIESWASEQEESSDKTYLKLCSNFLTWLREADEDEDDEEEEEEDD